MKTSIESLAYRSLRNLEHFTNQVDVEEWPLLKGEKLIGVYMNDKNNFVGISDLGLRPRKNLLIRYSEIAETCVEGPKNEAEDINLKLVSGQKLTVRFAGGKGRFRDVWEVSRFLARAKVNSTRQ